MLRQHKVVRYSEALLSVTTHESREKWRETTAVERPPDWQFGLVFSAVFAIRPQGQRPSRRPARWWSGMLAASSSCRHPCSRERVTLTP
jgi:hypothetical protein